MVRIGRADVDCQATRKACRKGDGIAGTALADPLSARPGTDGRALRRPLLGVLPAPVDLSADAGSLRCPFHTLPQEHVRNGARDERSGECSLACRPRALVAFPRPARAQPSSKEQRP
jgi:hypothetical protein